jgi:hypothetical protein
MYNLDPVTTIHLPAPVTSLAFGDNNDLYAGAQDGSIRLFDLPGTTVVRALRGLKDEVASIVSASTPKKNGTRQVWAACGNEVRSDYLCIRLVLFTEIRSTYWGLPPKNWFYHPTMP